MLTDVESASQWHLVFLVHAGILIVCNAVCKFYKSALHFFKPDFALLLSRFLSASLIIRIIFRNILNKFFMQLKCIWSGWLHYWVTAKSEWKWESVALERRKDILPTWHANSPKGESGLESTRKPESIDICWLTIDLLKRSITSLFNCFHSDLLRLGDSQSRSLDECQHRSRLQEEHSNHLNFA